MLWAEDFLFNIQQAERPLEHYVEEFLSVVHLVSWSDATINACFQMGLNDDRLFRSIAPDDCHKPVAEFINYVLALCNSNYYVDVEDSTLPPISKSDCSSSPPANVLHVQLQRARSLRSSLILSPEPAADPRSPPVASSRTPPAAHSRTPAMSPRSGLPAVSMASQINIMDSKDVCGFSSPVSPSPLVPSSSPKPPLIPSIPPECPPEPELPPARPPEPELPPVRPPEPALPPERPPEP
ncbi:hypothetical protein M9458_021425, partial [Cirrhinus mrigala]